MPKNNKYLSDQHRKNGFVPKKEDKRTRVAAWVLIILIAFCTVCSFLTLGMTVKNCEEANAEGLTEDYFYTAPLQFDLATYSGVTFANTSSSSVRTYKNGFNIATNYYSLRFYANSDLQDFSAVLFYYDWAVDDSGNQFRVMRVKNSIFDGTKNYYFNNFLRLETPLYYCGAAFQSYTLNDFALTSFKNDTSKPTGTYKIRDIIDTSQISYRFLNNSFDFANVYRVVFSIEADSILSYKVFYRYYDVKDNCLEIWAVTYGNYQKTNITYERFLNSDTDTAFDNGYNQGFQEGASSSDNSLYQKGFNIGKSQGYSQGYNAGLESANKYTFLNLIASVVDAPIQAVSGLLNFNLLGFNMLNFFYALLTLAIIIAVVRLIL